MKRIVYNFITVAFVLTFVPSTAFAHGHGRSVTVNQRYSLCGAENCNTTGTHQHSGVYYYGHYIGDGHDYHLLCDVQDCTLTGTHEHDEVSYLGHHNNDGHSYHNNSGSHFGGRHH